MCIYLWIVIIVIVIIIPIVDQFGYQLYIARMSERRAPPVLSPPQQNIIRQTLTKCTAKLKEVPVEWCCPLLTMMGKQEMQCRPLVGS